MFTLRRAAERGHAHHDWLDSRHTFSFADYQDPQHIRVSNLRVINEDRIAPGGGFAPHDHRDMEIITYVLDGALEHKDSMGNGSVIRPSDVQRMSAGTGVTHSEYNPSSHEPAHILQIWLLPNRHGVEPAYTQQYFAPETRQGRLTPLVSPDGRDGSIATHQDAVLYGGLIGPGDAPIHALAANRKAYVHVARGGVTVNGLSLHAGDGLTVEDESRLQFTASEHGEILLFDLP